MKKIGYWAVVLLFAGLIFAQNTADLEPLYKEGRTLYNRGDYQGAITVFEKIQGLDPNFRGRQVRSYLKSAKSKLGARETKETYQVQEPQVRQIEVRKEGELEVLSREAEKVLLDTGNYLAKVRDDRLLSEFQMLDPGSTLKMAQEAYQKSNFPDTIRLANKARFQAEQLLEKKTKLFQPALGEVGRIPVTLNLTDADLEQSLKLIYDLTGANIILSKGVTGRVTINVRDIPLQEVLNLICEANSLKYLEENKVIKVMTQAEYERRPEVQKAMNRRVFNVLYGDASAITKALKETFKLDSIVYEPRTNSLIVDIANPALARQIEEVISSLDTPVSQVLLEARIVEIAGSEDNVFSIDWMISSRLLTGLGSPTTLTGPRFGQDITYTPGVTSTLPTGFSFGITNSDVNSLISALATRGKVKLIQAPKIMCLNGTNAVIRVIQNYPYIIPEYEETYNEQGTRTGTRQTVEVFEEEVGTEFIVTPIIQRNRNVFLNLSIMDSRLVEVKKLTAVAANLRYETEQPIISTRETSQNVTLFDGQSLVCGGMIQDRKAVSETGVPFLRRIPVLGYLFKKPSYTESTSELLLFLTPHVVTTFQEADDLTRPDQKKSEQEVDPGILKRF